MVYKTELKNSSTIIVSEWNNGLYLAKFVSIDGSRLPMLRKLVLGK